MAHILTDYQYYWYYSAQLLARQKLMELSIQNLETQNKYLRDQLDATDKGLKDMSSLLDTEQDDRARQSSALRRQLFFWRAGTVVGILAAAFCGGALVMSD